MSDDREKLKALLLSEELAQLEALQKLLSNKQQLSEKISEVLSPAADLTIAQDPSFQKKFSKIDSKSFARAIKANKEVFVDALTPMIGPIIRRSVSSAIRSLSSDINRAIELGFSAKALKWRWLAFKTGVPFTEIVFNNTIEYQVQQIFLIDNQTGLLIQHAGQEESLLQDKDAMSAMLTAIQDFIHDSVSKSGESLTAAELGDSLLWLVQGNKANMAVVIKGAPTQRLNTKIISATEKIHIEFYQEIANQNLWNNSPELKLELETLLLTKTQSDKGVESKKSSFWPWFFILLFVGLLAWWGWNQYSNYQLKQQITTQLNQTPGFILSELTQKNGDFIAYGLQDPLADLSHVDDRAVIKSTPFISLEDEIIKNRIAKIFNDTQVNIDVIDQNVTLTGILDKTPDFLQKVNHTALLPGINQLIDQTEQLPAKETWKDFIKINPAPDNIEVTELGQVIHLTGYATQQNLDNFSNRLQKFGKTDVSSVEIISIRELKQLINNFSLNLINTKTLKPEQINHLRKISAAFSKLLLVQRDAKIKSSAYSDCQGPISISNKNGTSRLTLVKNYLTTQGISEEAIIVDLVECEKDTEQPDLSKIVVQFEVIP